MLLRLGESWVLIDCHLPEGQVRKRFFSLVDALRIQRLDLVCLTHPHYDHYLGMAEVIRYFRTAPRSVGGFCHTGFNSKLIKTLMRRARRPNSEVDEYERLDALVTELKADSSCRYFHAFDRSVPILISRDRQTIQLIPIGPTSRAIDQDVRDFLTGGVFSAKLNSISLVLVLRIQGGADSFDALLASDSDAPSLGTAFTCLAERTGVPKESVAFNMLKVPHHGSIASHRGSDIHLRIRTKAKSIAAVSAGPTGVLPDREVLRDFLAKDWIVLLTTKRQALSKASRVLLMASRRPHARSDFSTHDIKLSCSGRCELAWSPSTARIDLSELPNYSTGVGR